MKVRLLFSVLFAFLFISSFGQFCLKADSPEVKLERLRIKAQSEMDSVKLIAEQKLAVLMFEGQDSLSVLRFCGQSELRSLEREWSVKSDRIISKAQRGIINRTIRQQHFELELEKLNMEYENMATELEDKYNVASDMIESYYEHQQKIIEFEAQASMQSIEARYRKEIALLACETN